MMETSTKLIEDLHHAIQVIAVIKRTKRVMLNLHQETNLGEVLLRDHDMHPRMVNHKQDFTFFKLKGG
jgi:hypothetical protein